MRVGLFGGGAYGMALCSILRYNNHDVTIWTKTEQTKNEILKNRCNKIKLPGYKIDDEVKVSTDVETVIKDKDLLIIAIPAAYVSSLCDEMTPFIDNDNILIATKGIEQKTGLFISEIVENKLNTKNVAVISGPSFAVDLITRMPAGLTIASKTPETILLARQALQNSYIKLRDTTDVIGVEICGSIKNVIALAAGMLAGLKANESTKAMLLTEASHDMENILEAFDCDKRTVMSFAGIGDLILTCTSPKSRNFSFGNLIGEGASTQKVKEYLENTTVEGYYTLESIYMLLKDKKVTIPIIDLIYEIIVNGKDPNLLLLFLVYKS